MLLAWQQRGLQEPRLCPRGGTADRLSVGLAPSLSCSTGSMDFAGITRGGQPHPHCHTHREHYYPFMFLSVSISPLAALMRPHEDEPFHCLSGLTRQLLPTVAATDHSLPFHMLPPSPDSCTVPAADDGGDGALSGVIAGPGGGVGDIGSEDHEVVDAAQLYREGGVRKGRGGRCQLRIS